MLRQHRPVTQGAEMYCIPETEDIENAAEKQQEKKESLEELETAARAAGGKENGSGTAPDYV